MTIKKKLCLYIYIYMMGRKSKMFWWQRNELIEQATDLPDCALPVSDTRCPFAYVKLCFQEEPIERRAPAELPKEHFGHRILVKCLQLSWVHCLCQVFFFLLVDGSGWLCCTLKNEHCYMCMPSWAFFEAVRLLSYSCWRVCCDQLHGFAESDFHFCVVLTWQATPWRFFLHFWLVTNRCCPDFRLLQLHGNQPVLFRLLFLLWLVTRQ